MLNMVVCILVTGIMVGIGLDFRKWHNWLLIAYVFVSFFLIGIIETGNINSGIEASALFSFLALLGGAVINWNRNFAEKWFQNKGEK